MADTLRHWQIAMSRHLLHSFAEDSVSEFPFSPVAGKRIVKGVPAEAEFLAYILGLLEHIEISELEIIAVTRI